MASANTGSQIYSIFDDSEESDDESIQLFLKPEVEVEVENPDENVETTIPEEGITTKSEEDEENNNDKSLGDGLLTYDLSPISEPEISENELVIDEGEYSGKQFVLDSVPVKRARDTDSDEEEKEEEESYGEMLTDEEESSEEYSGENDDDEENGDGNGEEEDDEEEEGDLSFVKSDGSLGSSDFESQEDSDGWELKKSQRKRKRTRRRRRIVEMNSSSSDSSFDSDSSDGNPKRRKLVIEEDSD